MVTWVTQEMLYNTNLTGMVGSVGSDGLLNISDANIFPCHHFLRQHP